MKPHRHLVPTSAVPLGLFAAVVLAACGAGATTGAPASPAESMMDHTPAPVESMMDHSPMPAESMMDHTPAPVESMTDHSPMPAETMMDHSPMPSVAAPVSSGTFHGIHGQVSGTAALFHNSDGSFTITFEDFSADGAAGTHVILVTNKDVTRNTTIDPGSIVDLGPLAGTSGMQEYAVPASADAMTFHTVVIWDGEMAHAIAAAPLHS